MQRKSSNPSTFLTAAELRKRGWTNGLIARFLPDPDATRKDSHYRRWLPLSLYASERVIEIEVTDEFKAALARATARRGRSERPARRKRGWTLEQTQAIVIPPIAPIPMDELIGKACAHFNQCRDENCSNRVLNSDVKPVSPDSDPMILCRLAVVYLRHQQAKYEKRCGELNGQALRIIRGKVLARIREAYPWLAAECDRQEIDV